MVLYRQRIVLSERRLRWLGHVIPMDHQRIPRQALHWEVPGFKRGPGRPRANWRSIVNKDLSRIGITWEEAEVAAQNIRMASKCGPMHPFGCGLDQVRIQGQGQGQSLNTATDSQTDKNVTRTFNKSRGTNWTELRKYTQKPRPKVNRWTLVHA